MVSLVGKLPQFLKYRSAFDLVRIGNRNDGGYLVSLADVNKTDLLLGLGVLDNWTFEKQFLELKDVPLHTYDATISLKILFINTIKNLFRVKKLYKSIVLTIRFYNFFKKNRIHFAKHVGNQELELRHNYFVSLEKILSSLNYQNIFIKIDIEGGEYRILKVLLENSNKITGLVIEFHDCDLYLQEIKNFVKAFPQKIIHIHANNSAPIDLKTRLPYVLEISFSKYARLKKSADLNHVCDSPNNPGRSEISLSFEKK